jgi:hypothetical protein
MVKPLLDIILSFKKAITVSCWEAKLGISSDLGRESIPP